MQFSILATILALVLSVVAADPPSQVTFPRWFVQKQHYKIDGALTSIQWHEHSHIGNLIVRMRPHWYGRLKVQKKHTTNIRPDVGCLCKAKSFIKMANGGVAKVCKKPDELKLYLNLHFDVV